MRITWNEELNKLYAPYVKKIVEGQKHLDCDKDIAHMIGEYVKYLDCDKCEYSNFEEELAKYIEKHGIENVTDIFNGKLRQIPEYFLDEDLTKLFCTCMELEERWPYATGYYRRSQRSRKAPVHITKIADTLEGFVKIHASGMSDDEVLNNEKDSLCDDWLATKLYMGDQTCVDFIREAMTSENNSKRLAHAHFRAIVMSGHKELLELEGKLLLAARLQEGLRQAIIETADDGLPESYIHILKVIKANKLQRFAAVKRGLATTTGLPGDEAPDRLYDKILELVYLYITNPQEAYKAIESDDTMQVYLGLWAIGFYEAEQLSASIRQLIDAAPTYKVEAALLMLGCTFNPKLKRELAAEALRKRSDELGIVAGVLPLYFNDYFSYGAVEACMGKCFNSKEEAEHDFNLFAETFAKIDKSKTFSPYVFPWHSVELKRSEVAEMLCKIAIFVNTPDIIDRALEYFPVLDSFTRYFVVDEMFKKPTTRKQVAFLVEMMSNASPDVRTKVCKIVESLFEKKKLTPDDFRKMEEHLRLKASEMRVSIVRMFGQLPPQEATDTVRRLLKDKMAPRRLAGLEIIKNWYDKNECRELVQALVPDVEALPKPSQQEQVIINAICGTNISSEPFSKSNGFGLYDPEDKLRTEIIVSPDFDVEKTFLFEDPQTAVGLMKKIMKLIEENADYEFITAWGEKERLGNFVRLGYSYHMEGKDVLNLAYPELWTDFYEKEIKTTDNLLKLYAATHNDKIEGEDARFRKVQKKYFGKVYNHGLMKSVRDKKYYNEAQDVVGSLFQYFADETICEVAANLLSDIAIKVEPSELVEKHKGRWSVYETTYFLYHEDLIGILNGQIRRRWEKLPDDLFKRGFYARYELFRKTGLMEDTEPRGGNIGAEEFLRARRLGILTDEQLLHEMMGWSYSPTLLKDFTTLVAQNKSLNSRKSNVKKNIMKLDDEETRLINTAVSRVVEIELKRGDTPTEVSSLADNIKCVSGIDFFIRILTAFGKDKPVMYSNSMLNKRQIFSGFLACSMPGEDDTPEMLKKQAKQAKISDERLVEAAMYSTAWLDMVEKAIKWEGLASSAYYFLAHTGEQFSDRVKSHIARYTTVEPEDFVDGAFDPDWFHEVYSTLGKKRFDIVYDAAKYISEGNRHTRARKLSDAALGKYKVKPLMKEIKDKRNKDLVVALGLIPLSRNRMADITQRYDFLNKFLKESKQFGAQRQASESRAVQLALDNLARNAGYGDSTRLIWSMEAMMVSQMAEYFEPKEIEDGVTLHVEINDGTPELVLESKGKRLQSIPARLKKDKYVESAKEVHRKLKEQHARGRALLEKSMVDASEFTGDEIGQLKDNPVIWKMLSKLVLMKDGNVFGFPSDDGKSLVSAQGEINAIEPDDKLRIAHPYDLYTAGVWSEYQHLLFEKEWRQPFKQVFRELYLPTEEEKEDFKSMRFSGNQIMPVRAVGILKKRLWTVDYENGLQKVSFNGNVTAVMYAMADWFSPADIEAPTLEYVAFYDRRSMEEKKISEVAPLVFSEIMRDVDLAVSVAHAGGVDPEASHSTIEMRSIIVQHSLKMFGIGNVEVKGNFAKIKGTLGDYNVHLGSGVIHKEGGTQIAVLPIHSQSRGRIFLPFLDEDPKTSEIISKILLFSEDTKIKDPTILSQID